MAEGQDVTCTHGGDVERVARQSGIPPERLLDFSANVNPMGLPACAADRLARDARDPHLVSRYPDPEATEPRHLPSQKVGVPAECIVIGAGADSLIHAAVRTLKPQRCLIPVPAFSEYRRACQAYGCSILAIPLAMHAAGFAIDCRVSRLAEPGDLLILNNPHNPTGACTKRAEMLGLIASARSSGASVLADEAFIDYAPEAAITGEAAGQPGLIAIRSLTKFFGCPGLRVGYGVATAEIAREFAAQLPAWPVTSLALNAIAEALRDAEYARQAPERNRSTRALLSGALGRLGCHVFPSGANFLLVRLPDPFVAASARERLIREHGILVRECDSFEGLEKGRYLRVAVRQESENARLIQALERVFQEWS